MRATKGRGWPLVLSVVVAFSTASLGSRGVRAEETEPDPPPAKQLFAEGRRLATEGDFAAACPKFEESLRLEVGIGTQFNLADCWERIGRTASAHALFLGAAASAKAVGQTDREQVLRERAVALELRLTRLVVEVQDATPGLSVKRGELPLDPETLGKAMAVDPGKYSITARAPGKKAWGKEVEITGKTRLVTVTIPELEALAPPRPVEEVVPTKSAPAPAPARPTEPGVADRGRKLDYRVITLAGIGVAGLAAGSVMGFRYRRANKDAKKICPTSRDCAIQEIQDHDRLIEDARTARTWSYAGFGVGAAGLVGAGLLWYFQPRASSSAWQAAPRVSVRGELGATLVGSF